MATSPGIPATAPQELSEDLRNWMVRYGPALRTYFRKKVGPSEAEDLVQEVFVNLQDRGRVDDIEHVNRYLFRVAANMLIRRGQAKTWDWADHAGLEELELFDELSPERALIAKQDLSRLMEALRCLPPRVEEAFVLHRFEDMTYREIAQRMGIKPKSVEALIMRALERIAAIVEAPR
jgi:RNA polymerase sigma-70 factor (ECF subfamily)